MSSWTKCKGLSNLCCDMGTNGAEEILNASKGGTTWGGIRCPV